MRAPIKTSALKIDQQSPHMATSQRLGRREGSRKREKNGYFLVVSNHFWGDHFDPDLNFTNSMSMTGRFCDPNALQLGQV